MIPLHTLSRILEWINKFWHTYATNYYAATKMSNILQYTTIWIILTGIMLSKRSQTKKSVNDSIYKLKNQAKPIHNNVSQINGDYGREEH